MPGEHAQTKVTLMKRMPLMVGQAFTIRENKSTVVTGVITKKLESVHVVKTKLNKLELPG